MTWATVRFDEEKAAELDAAGRKRWWEGLWSVVSEEGAFEAVTTVFTYAVTKEAKAPMVGLTLEKGVEVDVYGSDGSVVVVIATPIEGAPLIACPIMCWELEDGEPEGDASDRETAKRVLEAIAAGVNDAERRLRALQGAG